MSEHLPECWAQHESDPPAWCICDELRACEARVTVLATPETVAQATYWYEQGQRDALAAAVQRVEDMPDWSTTYVSRVEVIARMRLQAVGSNAQRMLIEHGEDWRGGYDKALDAAREAVANAPMASGAFNTKAADLAAIDALRHAGAKNQQTSCAGNC
jgi:hypothetical protein